MGIRRTTRPIAFTLAILLAGQAPAAVFAAGNPPRGDAVRLTDASIVDVAMDPEKRLSGLVNDRDAKPLAGIEISARDSRGGLAGSVTTTKGGEFTFSGLKGGLYTLQFGDQQQLCRLWTTTSAPPGARQQLLLVNDSAAVRGQVPRAPILFLIPIAAAVGVYVGVKEREEVPHGS